MQYKVYGVIEIGGYTASLNVYEISRKSGIRILDRMSYPIELGRDSYASGKISQETANVLCTIIREFAQSMKGYQVDAYIAVADSAVREAINAQLILAQVRQKTGVEVQIYSNSEMRFISYKALASRQDVFEDIIQKGTAIVDIGGGSIQISLFDKDNLIMTQNLRFGNLRVRERLAALRRESLDYHQMVQELIEADITSFCKMHLKDRKIANVVLLGDYFSLFVAKNQEARLENRLSAQEFAAWCDHIITLPLHEQADRLGMDMEYASLLVPTAVLYRTIMEAFEAENVWIPGVEMADGFAYEYGEKNRLIKPTHNFENDILMAARNIGKRYAISKSHVTYMSTVAMTIFDSMKRIHGLGARERLLLEIAVLLHDCGKYISMSQVGECSFNIIMATEIIGLSHREREIIALVVRYNTQKFGYYQEISRLTGLNEDDYVLVAKLTAILRVANSLDRAHKQKVEGMKVTLQDQKLIIRLETHKDLTLEKGLLGEKLDFFEEVFNIRPEIRTKKLV